MRFGLYLPSQGPFADPRLLADLAVQAERAGWDGVFIWDELLPILDGVGDMADAFVSLAAMASVTHRIRMGALVSPVARLRPEAFALQTATLDRLTNGRLTIGVGLGNPDTQFTAFGGSGDVKVRAAMVDEFLDLLTRLWTGEAVEFQGSYYEARGVTLHSPLVQQPRIPIWIGADSANRAPRRRAARWDGFAPASHDWPDSVISVREYEKIVADIRGARTSDEPFDVVVIGDAAATRPAPGELAAYEAAGVTWMLVQALTVDDARSRTAAGPPAPPH